MSVVPASSLLEFVGRIGWTSKVLGGRDIPDDMRSRLSELAEFYDRKAVWEERGFGRHDSAETQEQYLNTLRICVDGNKVWSIDERLHDAPERPKYKLSRRSPDGDWEEVGYFNVWPLRWRKHWDSTAPGLFQRLIFKALMWINRKRLGPFDGKFN